MFSDPIDPPFDFRAFMFGLLLGVLVVGGIWLGVERTSDDEGPRARDASRRAASPAARATRPATASETEAVLAVCRGVYDGQEPPLRTANRAMTQWEVHIGAMNKLVVGAITLDQATRFWDQTRVGAQRRLANYEAEHHQFDSRMDRCPRQPPAGATDPDLLNCQQAATARSRALRLADVALRTWSRHVHHMEMLRRGEITPAAATREWLQSWQEGNREVRAYRSAARAAGDLTC